MIGARNSCVAASKMAMHSRKVVRSSEPEIREHQLYWPA
jgi:hypothetical protein